MADPDTTAESSNAEAKKTGILSKPKVYLPLLIGFGAFAVTSVACLLDQPPAGHPLCILWGFVLGIIAAVVSWLAMLIIPRIWYFSLARLKELSNAIRGK